VHEIHVARILNREERRPDLRRRGRGWRLPLLHDRLGDYGTLTLVESPVLVIVKVPAAVSAE
jgi:hypothetical protein